MLQQIFNRPNYKYLQQFSSIYYQIKLNLIILRFMKLRTKEQLTNIIGQVEKNPFFLEFTSYLGKLPTFIPSSQDLFIFFSYYLSRKVDLIVRNIKLPADLQRESQFELVQQIVMQDEEIKKISLFMRSKINRLKLKSQKDRKTSFFRIIIKHLKKGGKTSLSSGRQSDNLFLKDLQDKLSNNTISNTDIASLFQRFTAQICSYLNSSEIYRDLLLTNRSRRNKHFYILHLRQISAIAESQGLQNFSFFEKFTIEEQIRNIAKACYTYQQSSRIKNQEELSLRQLPILNSSENEQFDHLSDIMSIEDILNRAECNSGPPIVTMSMIEEIKEQRDDNELFYFEDCTINILGNRDWGESWNEFTIEGQK